MLERWQATSASVRGAGIFETAFLVTRTAEIPASPSAARISSMRSSAVDQATLCILRIQRLRFSRSTRSSESWDPRARGYCPLPNSSLCRSGRIVLGGVAPIPWRLPKVEQMLAGERITEALAAKAAEAALEGAKPLAKNAYKVPLTKGVVRRTLLELAARG